MLTVFQRPYSSVLLPLLSRVSGNRARMSDVLHQTNRVTASIFLPSFSGAAAIFPVLIPWLFGEKWIDSVVLCQIFMAYSLIVALSTFIYPTLVATGGVNKYLYISWFTSFGAIFASLLGVQYSVEAVVIALCINILGTSLLAGKFISSRVDYGNRDWIFGMLPAVVSSLVMYCFVTLLLNTLCKQWPLPISVITGVVTGALIYILTMYCAFQTTYHLLKKSFLQLLFRNQQHE
jgi:O-antigen/teichoic acid export membrane protein